MSFEIRQVVWEEYLGRKNSSMRRMFLDYTRYFEAEAIINHLKTLGTKFQELRVLDFGCGVADYGISFAREGSDVFLFDIDQDALNFAIHRFEIEGQKVRVNQLKNLSGQFELAIFGEVLDHVDEPFKILIDLYYLSQVKYIFTSSYPFRSNDPNEAHWQHDHHPKTALKEQSLCRLFLETKFDKVNFGGERNLWIRKK